MSETRSPEPTRAERKAESYAEIARGYGLEAEVQVTHEPASYYSSGEVMFPASVVAWVRIAEPFVLGENLNYGWRSYLAGQGRPATTRGIVGWSYEPLRKPSTRRLRNERTFANRLHVYSYRLRIKREGE